MIKNNTGSQKDKEYEKYQLQKLYEMKNYHIDEHYICNYFGENNMYKCENCDNCMTKDTIIIGYDDGSKSYNQFNNGIK